MKTNNDTLNIDTSEEYISSLDKDSAVMIVHNIGNIVNVPKLKGDFPGYIILEDNCESIGGKFQKNRNLSEIFSKK